MKTPVQGETFRHERTCDRYRPIYYAAASGDFNPIHIDAEVARAVGLGGTILQGMCTLAWLAEACTAYAEDPTALVALSLRFTRPVAIGDRVTFEGRCGAVSDGLAQLSVGATNQRGEPVLKAARAEIRVPPATMTPTWTRTTTSTSRPTANDPRVGRAYGPYRYEACGQKIRDFALAVSGGIPTSVFTRPPADAPGPPPHPWHVDDDAARSSPWGALVAPPTFAAAYAMQPFAAACLDPANGLDALKVLHGEQELCWWGVVRAGDVLATRGEIAAFDRKGAMDVVVVTSRTVNQRGELVLEGVWTAVVPR